MNLQLGSLVAIAVLGSGSALANISDKEVIGQMQNACINLELNQTCAYIIRNEILLGECSDVEYFGVICAPVKPE
ncbi:hypothetical protein K5B43_000661 [Vibrio parahaemolyticus]|nr:hypothetical protein [Vibrio parahaemolyticus]